MIIKGYQCREAKHLGYREYDPTMDVNTRGETLKDDILSGYVSIVKIKNCRIYTDDKGIQRYDSSDAPSIPIDHFRTNGGYGKKRFNNHPTLLKNQDTKEWEMVDQYWSCPVYFVIDAKVWRGTRKWNVKPEELAEREAQKA